MNFPIDLCSSHSDGGDDAGPTYRSAGAGALVNVCAQARSLFTLMRPYSPVRVMGILTWILWCDVGECFAQLFFHVLGDDMFSCSCPFIFLFHFSRIR